MAAAQRRIVWPLNSRSTTTSPVAHPERRCAEARRSRPHISGQLQVLNRAEMPKRRSQKGPFCDTPGGALLAAVFVFRRLPKLSLVTGLSILCTLDEF